MLAAAPRHGMAVETGDRVTIDYVARFDDGTVFDTSDPDVAEANDLDPDREYGPLTYVVGSKPMVAALEEGLLGMEVGETRTVEVPHEDFVQSYDHDEFERMLGETDPAVGTTVRADSGMIGEVVRVDDERVEVDFDPERAGRTMRFEVTLQGVE